MKDINEYALKLLKNKNYFIKDLFDKLIKLYERKEVCNTLKVLLLNGYINDRSLIELKTDYLINKKMVGKNYVYKYFESKKISKNLVSFCLSKYKSELFEKNQKQIIDRLKSKGKTDEYIYKYLEYKGYDV